MTSIIYRGFEIRPSGNVSSAAVTAIIAGRTLLAVDIAEAIDLVDQHFFSQEFSTTLREGDDRIDGTETLNEVLEEKLLAEPDVEHRAA